MTARRPAALQDRSANTQDRLCDAAEGLLRGGGLAACTIQAVAERAKRAPASVYRRFGDKDRMIEAVLERYLARTLEANKANFEMLRRRFPDLEGRLKAVVDGTIAGRRRDGRLAEAFREAAARSSRDSFPKAARRMREVTLSLASEALHECAADPARARRIDLALGVLAGAIETLMRAPQPFSDRFLRNELYTMLLSYLTAADHRAAMQTMPTRRR